MKRDPALRELSVDHHHALVHAHRLQAAAREESSDEALLDAVRPFLQLWREETTQHFREEEEILLPLAGRYSPGVLHEESLIEMLTQHAVIRGAVMALEQEVDPGTLRRLMAALGGALEAHVRMEERVAFPLIESHLTAEQKQELADRLAHDERHRKRGGHEE